MRELDRAFFHKKLRIAAARVHNNKDISMLRTSLQKSKDLLRLDRYPSIHEDPDVRLAEQGKRCLLLRTDLKHDGREF